MKRLLLSAIMLSALSAYAVETTEPTDTVINIENPSSVVLSETPKGVKLTVVEGEDSITTFSYNHPDPGNVNIRTSNQPTINSNANIVISSWCKSSKTKYEMISGGLAFGKNFAMGQPAPMDITTGKSWEISWMYILGLRISRGGNSFKIGLGLNWRNYKLTGPYQFVKTDGAISLGGYPEGASSTWSRLKVTTLSVPMIYSRRIWKGLNVQGGAIVNFTTHSSVRSKFCYEDREIQTSENGVYPRPVTLDFYGAVTVCGFGWYVRYSPMKVLRTSHGPQFSTLSTGVVLFL